MALTLWKSPNRHVFRLYKSCCRHVECLDEGSASKEASAFPEHRTQEQSNSKAPNRTRNHDLIVPDVEDQAIVLIQINAYSHEEILRVGEKMDLQKVGRGHGLD